MTPVLEFRRQRAVLIFEVEDRFVRELGLAGPHPHATGPFQFFAVAQVVAGQRRPLDHPLELEIIRNAGGFHLFFGKTKPQSAAGSKPPGDPVSRGALVPGTYIIRVTAPLYQAAEIEVDIDTLFSPGGPRPGMRGPFQVDLEPGYAYPFPKVSPVAGFSGPTVLRGAVRDTSGRPVENVEVEVAGGSNLYRTGANGQWVLVFPDEQPSGAVTVTFRIPQQPALDVQAVSLIAGRQNSLEQAALRGSVLTVRGNALNGAAVSVAAHPGETRTDADGQWFYYFPLGQDDEMVSVTAVLSDGRRQTQNNVPVRRRATSVVPTFRF